MLFLFLRYEAGQLKIMCVGGPNVRKDYHIDEGEEVINYRFIKAQFRCCASAVPNLIVIRFDCSMAGKQL